MIKIDSKYVSFLRVVNNYCASNEFFIYFMRDEFMNQNIVPFWMEEDGCECILKR